ncbi:hypothetical protein Scep_026083 [Stephania cephalantha]|uniref:Uncharacterized protein n=1 Tax=Stephania cephalantha TaxID=152367 RepID=A0AAP0ETC8_9MAGN
MNWRQRSVAARQRRRRITEKTPGAGKLMNWWNKMNTVEMFHSAFKYIKFLQAQVGFLQFMASIDQLEKSNEEQKSTLLIFDLHPNPTKVEGRIWKRKPMGIKWKVISSLHILGDKWITAIGKAGQDSTSCLA